MARSARDLGRAYRGFTVLWQTAHSRLATNDDNFEMETALLKMFNFFWAAYDMVSDV